VSVAPSINLPMSEQIIGWLHRNTKWAQHHLFLASVLHDINESAVLGSVPEFQ